MKKLLDILLYGTILWFVLFALFGVYVAHMNKVQRDRVQNLTTNSAATNVVAEADTNVRTLKFTVKMHLTNEVPARPTNGTGGR